MNIAIYTNILTPYRKHFYDALYAECERNGDNFHVLLMASTEPNRNWNYDEYKTEYTMLLDSKTITLGNAYIHINKNLKAVLKNLRLDVIICAGSYLCPGVWDVLAWKKKLGYETFYWSESHLNEIRNYSGIKIRLREVIREKIYKKFDGFWYAGEMSLRFIKKYANENAKMFFMPNLIEEAKYPKAALVTDAEKIILRDKYQVDKANTVFICPARLSSVKGIDRFISLFAKCPDNHKATILVAGDGELKEVIEKKSKDLKVDVRLLGFRSQDSIIELYKLSDIFLLPSLSDPNPLTCIEALWAGLPLFISEHCGNYPEVIRAGENGFVFSYKDSKDAILKLQKVINTDAGWRKNAKCVSQNIANEKYCSNKVVIEIMSYYHNK